MKIRSATPCIFGARRDTYHVGRKKKTRRDSSSSNNRLPPISNRRGGDLRENSFCDEFSVAIGGVARAIASSSRMSRYTSRGKKEMGRGDGSLTINRLALIPAWLFIQSRFRLRPQWRRTAKVEPRTRNAVRVMNFTTPARVMLHRRGNKNMSYRN